MGNYFSNFEEIIIIKKPATKLRLPVVIAI